MQCDDNDETLTAIFRHNPGKPVPECLHSGLIIGIKDDGGGGEGEWRM